jgi:hypothetical protein
LQQLLYRLEAYLTSVYLFSLNPHALKYNIDAFDEKSKWQVLSKESVMNHELIDSFLNPDSMLRGAPFWSWNCKLDKDQLIRQIEIFRQMGIGGFHMHPRTGMDTEYLGKEYMEMVKACTEKAQELGMKAWLYDEDRWPSGFAGGLVTKDEQYRARHLLFTPQPYSSSGAAKATIAYSGAVAKRYENGVPLAAYKIRLENGLLKSHERISQNSIFAAQDVVWYAYLETAVPSTWFNNQTYVDTLNPKAIERFVEITHERYKKYIGDHFGKTVAAIFTDEPQFTRKITFKKASDRDDIVIPFTTDFCNTFKKKYKADLLDYLPEIFWELPDGQISIWRYRYHDHVCERFAQAFVDVIGTWCEKNGIALTGHLMEEPTLKSQTAALGEAMRNYRKFQIPGIDVLIDKMEDEFTTAKQAQSAAHQFGRPGTLSELYGVTNWDFDFAGHKRQGDWQAALGVLYRVHHLTWVSMEGEAKRDYPASIGYQSPWWKEYRVVEDHFARVNALLSRGKPVVRIGVIHPIESFWLHWGPDEQTLVTRNELDKNFKVLTLWMLYGFADFDFISESLLTELKHNPDSDKFTVGDMEYDVILVPGLHTIRSSTLKRLSDFVKKGGQVIFTGEIPYLVDAKPSGKPAQLAKKCRQIPFTRSHILDSLRSHVEVQVLNPSGVQADGFLHQLRQEGNDRILFICNTDRYVEKPGMDIRIRGEWKITHMDTISGDIQPVQAQYTDGLTSITWDFPAHGSILLVLSPGRYEQKVNIPKYEYREIGRLTDPVPVTLSEPNVLLLDCAEFRINDGPWQPKEHLLRIDGLVRKELGLQQKGGEMAQPWTVKEDSNPVGEVTLRFKIESEINIQKPSIALENASNTEILLDGKGIEKRITGYFTDESIKTIKLPDISPGSHSVELRIGYSAKAAIEWCYLLGDFGVQVNGSHARITRPVRNLTFGDFTSQGLPFYGGNVTYHCSIENAGEIVSIRIPHFKGALVKAVLDGQDTKTLAFAPFRAEFKTSPGKHKLDLTVFGNRVNCFGAVHNMAYLHKPIYWWGPSSWRTSGDGWSDEYQLRAMGIVIAPVIERKNPLI